MSKINIHRSTFLEKEELNRMIGFSAEKTVIEAILSVSTSFGLVSIGGVPGEPFSMVKSSSFGGVDIEGGYIITSDLEAFYSKSIFNYNSIPADGETYYIKAVCEKQVFEPGYVQVDTNGNISGTVNFSNLIRGQSSGVPSCIRFVKDDGSEPLNNSVYQVVDIINPNNIVLSSGYQFIAEQQLRVIILGSVPMGRRFTDEQLQGLYSYNVINFKYEKVSDFTGRADNEFYIGRVRKDTSGVVVDVLDERYSIELCPYWKGFGGGGGSEVFSFTIVPTPSNALVMMNGRETSTIRGENGLVVDWTVSKPGYYSQSGSHTIDMKNVTLPVTLEVNPTPETSTIKVYTESGDSSQGGVGIDNPNTNVSSTSKKVLTGETVTLYAHPAGTNQFLGWYDGTKLLSTQNPYKYPVNGNITITASFGEYWDFDVLTKSGEYEAFGVSPKDGSAVPEQFLVKVN